MKRLWLFIIALTVCASQVGAFGIVNNSGTAGADSIAFPFYALDSAGNVVATASGDSIFVSIYYPDGTVAYQDSGAYDDAKITSQAVSSYTHYVWKEAVADIDGASPSQGVYDYILIVKDLTGANIATPFHGTFQLYTESDFNLVLDMIKDALDTLQNQDDWAAHQSTVDSLPSATKISDTAWAAASRTITGTGTDAITATSIATDAIGADEIAANAIGASEIATDAIGAGEIAANAIGASELATDAVAEIVDATWNEDTTSHNTAASYGVLLKDTIVYQGAASGLDSAAVYGAVIQGISDSAADVSDVFRNVDTSATLDTSAVGTWLKNNAGGATDIWSNIDTATTVDTSGLGAWLVNNLKAITTVASCTLVNGDSISKLPDTIYYATAADFWRNVDTSATVDTSDLGTWMANNLSSAAAWTNAKIDSIMVLVRSDSVVAYKVWGDSSARALTGTVVIKDTTASGQYVGTGDIGGSVNLVHNPGFEDDTAYATAHPPQNWTQRNGTWSSSYSVPSGVGGRWDYRPIATVGEQMILDQNVGWLNTGHYNLSCDMRNNNGDSVGLVIDYGTSCGTSGWTDSIMKTTSGMNGVGKEITITTAGNYAVGLIFWANSVNDYADFDNVRLEYASPLMIVAQDTTQSGDSIATGTASITAANMAQIADSVWGRDTAAIAGATTSYGELMKDTSAFQGSASGLSASEIMDSASNRGFVTFDTSAVLSVNMAQISTDATAADNFETMLDGTGGGELDLGKLAIRTTTSDDTGLVIMSATGTEGYGAFIFGDREAMKLFGNYGYGLNIESDTGVRFSGTGVGFEVNNSLGGADMILSGNGKIRGIVVPADTNASGKYIGLKPSNWTAADTSAYQGAGGGGSDTTAIKTCAANNPAYFYGPSATGTGAYTVKIVVVDTTSSGSHALPNIRVAAYDTSQSALSAVNLTGNSGSVTFNLAAGIYGYVCDQPGYTFPGNGYATGLDTSTVSGSQTDTIFCYHADAGMTTVWGLITDIGADSLQDVYVTFDMAVSKNSSVRRDIDSALAYPKTRTVQSDSNGRWEITLYASDALHVSNRGGTVYSDSVLYNVTFAYGGTSMEFKGIDVPDTTSVAWKDLR